MNMAGMNIVGLVASPFDGSQQAFEWPGEWFELEVSMPPMEQEDAELWITFLLSLRGQSGTFYYGDPSRSTPAGVATGTPKVNGSNAAGSKTLATKGWTHSITGILKAGDYLQIGSGITRRLYKVMKDANSDGSGNSTLDIFPRLREALSDNTAITTTSCTGVFRLAENRREWNINAALQYGIQFKAVEAI
jgi:hypothetical protein